MPCNESSGKRSAASRWASSAAFLLLALLMPLLFSACATYERQPLQLPDALGDVHTKSEAGVTVSAAILTDEQARAHFGLDIGENEVQAIWLRVVNATDTKLWFMRNALDPDFYSADELAMVMHSSIRDADREGVLQYLRDESIRVLMRPQTVTQGFIFAPKAIGGRYVDVRLVQDAYSLQLQREAALARGEAEPEATILQLRFGFAVPLPDGIFDYERLDPEHTYAGRELPDLSRDELRAALEALPCCAASAEGEALGDPLNIVIVGSSTDALNSLARAGWSFTHRITLRSITRLAGAALQGNSYPVAPVSNLYLFDRKQDFALQRGRANIAQRNHMRLWLAPFRHRGMHVWVGQVSRDIGIKVTPKSPSLTTHIIDPEVDMTREYLLHSLLAEGFVESFGFVAGSRAATREEPAVNLADDPYFSDGLRLVVILSSDPVPYAGVENLLWEQTQPPVAEGQTQNADRNSWPIGARSGG